MIHIRITMPATASIRDLRNRFPRVRKIVEAEGEILLTESGKTKYRLVLHTPRPRNAPKPIDYWGRLTAYQPTSLSAEQSQSLQDENRGDR